MFWYEHFDEKVKAELPELVVEADALLQKHTSFRIGGPARRMAFPETREQLVRAVELAESCGGRWFILGKGTRFVGTDDLCATEGFNSGELADDRITL